MRQLKVLGTVYLSIGPVIIEVAWRRRAHPSALLIKVGELHASHQFITIIGIEVFKASFEVHIQYGGSR